MRSTPERDRELLRDAIADDLFTNHPLLQGETEWADRVKIADCVIAVIDYVLRHNPDAISAFGWTCSPDGYFPPIALGHSQGADT